MPEKGREMRAQRTDRETNKIMVWAEEGEWMDKKPGDYKLSQGSRYEPGD